MTSGDLDDDHGGAAVVSARPDHDSVEVFAGLRGSRWRRTDTTPAESSFRMEGSRTAPGRISGPSDSGAAGMGARFTDDLSAFCSQRKEVHGCPSNAGRLPPPSSACFPHGPFSLRCHLEPWRRILRRRFPDAVAQPVTFSIDGPTQRLEMVVATSRILTLEHKIPRLLVDQPGGREGHADFTQSGPVVGRETGGDPVERVGREPRSLHRRCRRDSGRAGPADADQVRVSGRGGAGAAVVQQRLPHRDTFRVRPWSTASCGSRRTTTRRSSTT